MIENNEHCKQAGALRKRAEAKVRTGKAGIADTPSPEETKKLLHELRVHQIELEMQNEELRRAQTELEASRARYFDLYDLAPVGYLTLNEKGLILEANITVAGMLGVDRNILRKQPLTGFIFRDDQDIYYRGRKKIFDTGAPQSFDIRFVRPGAAPFWARIEAALALKTNCARECRAVVSDIGERRLIEQKTLHFASFPQLNPHPIVEVDASGAVTYHNQAAQMILEELGMDRSDARVFLPSDLDTVLAEWDKKAVLKLYREILINDRCFGTTIQLLPQFNVVRIYATEITKRKLSEEALRKTHEELETRVRERTTELAKSHEELRELARHLQSAREDERLKISREIHDELGQMLTALKLDLDFIRNDLTEVNQELYEKVDSDIGMVDEIIRSIKRICDELRPSILDHFGIEAAIECHALEFQRSTGTRCTVESGLGDCIVDKDRSTALFRILQEALTNVSRHSGATAVAIIMRRVDDNIALEISDNGKGICSEQLSKPRSFGLIGMRERVFQLGGDIHIASEENKGTTIKATIPLI